MHACGEQPIPIATASGLPFAFSYRGLRDTCGIRWVVQRTALRPLKHGSVWSHCRCPVTHREGDGHVDVRCRSAGLSGQRRTLGLRCGEAYLSQIGECCPRRLHGPRTYRRGIPRPVRPRPCYRGRGCPRVTPGAEIARGRRRSRPEPAQASRVRLERTWARARLRDRGPAGGQSRVQAVRRSLRRLPRSAHGMHAKARITSARELRTGG